MEDNQPESDWRLKLRYGKIQTPYKHFTVMAEGIVGELTDGFSCRPGKAWMSMRSWASSSEESSDMIQAIGKQVGFTVTGRILVYDTEPAEPPSVNPHGYDISFYPFGPEGNALGAT